MRASTALIVAGILTVVAGLSGASLAAEDPGRVTPGAEVEVADESASDDAAAAEGAEPAAAPADDEGNGRTPDEVETEPIESGNGGDRGDRQRDRADRERDDDEADKQKQPLADVNVKMKDIAFKPKSVTIAPGDEVTWKNFDTAQHDAVGQGGADFDTDLLDKGETATVPFNDEGTFDYICTVHPTMKGTVVVRSSGSGGGDDSGTASDSGTGGSTDSTAPADTTGSSGGFSSSGSSSGGGGSLPATGGVELPLLLFGAGLIVVGLLARAFHEYWIWR